MSFFRAWRLSQDPFETTALPASDLGRTLLVGRKKELARFTTILRSTRRIATLEGANGVGKTSLANVGAYVCYEEHLRRGVGPLLIPCNRAFQLRPDASVESFSLDVLMEVSQTLITRRDELRAKGRLPTGLKSVDRWLNSAQIGSWQTTAGIGGAALGFGRGPQFNEAVGYERSGFRREVLSVLTDIFTGSGEGVVCVIDNLELLESSDHARKLLEQLRDELLHVVGLRWVLAGAGGIIHGVASSPRLEGFLAAPILVEGIEGEAAADVLTSRIRAFALDEARAPYLPLTGSDFALLASILAGNIRSALGRASSYCEWIASRPGRLPQRDAQKHELFMLWLEEESKRTCSAVDRMLSPRAWQVFDTAVSELSGYFSPSDYAVFGFNSLQNLRPYVKDLEAAGLVAATRDDSDKRRKTIQVVAKGWLVHYARQKREEITRSEDGPSA